MSHTIETLAGVTYVIIHDGNNVMQIPLEAISSWGALLGHTDPGDSLDAILSYNPPVSASDIWGGLYEAVTEGLDEMSQSGVPPEFAEELLQDDTAPLPTQEARDKLKKVRGKSEEVIQNTPSHQLPASLDIDALKADLAENYGQQIQEARVSFIDNLQPVYNVIPQAGEGT
jgi:hypothetical protein